MLSNRSESDAIAGPRLQSERTLASSHSALGRLADGILARLAQSRVMLFDAEQDTTRARLEAGALLLDIRSADSRTAAVRVSAALQGSERPGKFALMHAAS